QAAGAGGGGGGRATTGTGKGLDFGKMLKDFIQGPETVSFEDALRATLSGQGAGLEQRLQSIARATPSTRDIKPTVAMDVNINNWNFSAGAFQIQSTDPKKAGEEVVRAIHRELRKEYGQAALALASGVIR
ncbi:MAG TPA: hypothetical protein VFB62_01690, partial [Polyangiaceae bacterium]|nr:hypothetical protein [Polyangiaceae bacterium]